MSQTEQGTVVRTERGLAIQGTRITLYQIMDYLKAEWPPKLIRHWFDLTEPQMTAVMDYIAAHRQDIEAEYQIVLQQAEAERHYWETANQERFAQIASWHAQQRDPLWEKIQARKRQLGIS